MPVFSFTAPHITPEEEQAERDSLTPEMLQEIQDDLYGVDNDDDDDGNEKDDTKQTEEDEIVNNDTSTASTASTASATTTGAMKIEKLIHRKIDEMNQYIHEHVPAIKKKDYLEAQSRVPQLIEKESNPIKFLRCEKFHVHAAATRLLMYWKMRRKLFGDVRAFLPLTLTGALADDLNVIETGVFGILPTDQKGRGVLVFDRIRAIPPLAPRDSVLRAMFYMIHVMAEDISMQKSGYVCLTNIKGYDLYKHFDRLLTKQSSIIMVECMPIKLKADHLLAGSANGVMSLVLPVMKHVVARELRLRMVVHSGTDEKIVDSLLPYGLTSINVVQSSGGEYKPNDFITWLEYRKVHEMNVAMATSAAAAAAAASTTVTASTSASATTKSE